MWLHEAEKNARGRSYVNVHTGKGDHTSRSASASSAGRSPSDTGSTSTGTGNIGNSLSARFRSRRDARSHSPVASHVVKVTSAYKKERQEYVIVID